MRCARDTVVHRVSPRLKRRLKHKLQEFWKARFLERLLSTYNKNNNSKHKRSAPIRSMFGINHNKDLGNV